MRTILPAGLPYPWFVWYYYWWDIIQLVMFRQDNILAHLCPSWERFIIRRFTYCSWDKRWTDSADCTRLTRQTRLFVRWKQAQLWQETSVSETPLITKTERQLEIANGNEVLYSTIVVNIDFRVGCEIEVFFTRQSMSSAMAAMHY